ncbi:hypothetical protein SAMN04489712_102410 [Thermomonospora echinospora]|uniref:DUF6286 domain-containing protein n=1 Tax=Thermomonospora echinospora TaxID=1992 RepID=A0A1H5VQR8_9ACTN|nr:DUF6286 domain-containing protein [Thermomonospora echinospora]SEF89308.1 hypothetical protein SAMN04489712_102410 [Thermomonospora echinospora]
MTTHAGQRRPARTSPAQAPTVDRTARRAARRAFRPRRRLPALLVSSLLIAAGVIVAAEVISTLVGSPLRLVDYGRAVSWLTGTSWNDPATRAAAAVISLLGLACLLAGLRPGHTSLIPLRSDDPHLVMGVTERGLRRAVAAAAADVEMITSVRRVKVRRHRVIVEAETALRDPGGLTRQVGAAVTRRLEELGPRPRRAVSVRVRSTEG